MAIEFSSRNEARKISQVPDWSDSAQAGDHLWQPTSISGDFCYVGESECSVCIRVQLPNGFGPMNTVICYFANDNFNYLFVFPETRAANEVLRLQDGRPHQLHQYHYESNAIIVQTIVSRCELAAVRRKADHHPPLDPPTNGERKMQTMRQGEHSTAI